MSNKKKNYNNYSKMSTEPKVEEIVETVSEVEEVVETPKQPEVKVVYGVVANCEKLNVRSKPSKQSEVVCVIAKGDEVVIGKTKGDFYAVSVNNGTEGANGFCMKEFIKIK